ncbi:Uncharacterised protein [Enterobacter hormaechei]|nr:Uncharacterised protein [Enterobacter hormaechei]SAB46029.1 Uncharacterised protein [Enterobacter hormaechei]SAE84714.1 Uncharacterised protein [Enterobacter hormaechei]SAG00696.1 Uncharacterised protein [Enterobacter hormaechei]VAF20277.1 Uncharacterised protein [Enterobacter hormaechei]
MNFVQRCRSSCNWRPSTRRPDQSEKRDFAFDGENTRSRSRPPIRLGDSANVDSENRCLISGHNAVSKRSAIYSGSGASKTTTGLGSSRKRASRNSFVLKPDTRGYSSPCNSFNSAQTASFSSGNADESSSRSTATRGILYAQSCMLTSTLFVRTQPARGTL